MKSDFLSVVSKFFELHSLSVASKDDPSELYQIAVAIKVTVGI